MTNKYTTILSLVFFSLALVGNGQAAIVSDDFESGNLDNWMIGGRQLGTHIANVITCDTGSLCGHLYQSGSFTEIYIAQSADFDPNQNINFDLKVNVATTPPPASNYFGVSGVNIRFYDQNEALLGHVWYLAATTNYPSAVWTTSSSAVNVIAENTWHHFDFNIQDMLSQITVDQSQIFTTQLMFETYSSTWPSPTVTAELWVDNVNTSVVPAPASVWLFGSGLIGLIGVARRRARN